MNAEKVTELMQKYFEARRNGDYEAVWELCYDPYGDSKKDLEKLMAQETAMSKASMGRPNYQLVRVEGEPERKENYDADIRWNGGWFVNIVYQDFRERKAEIVVHEKDGKVLLNWCKMI